MRFVALLLFCSCSSVITTQAELKVYSQNNGVRTEDLDKATYLVIKFLKEAKPTIYNDNNIGAALEGVIVRVSDHLISCPSENGAPCQGIAVENEIIYKHNNCIAKTAFVHELLHVIRGKVEGDMDAQHADFLLFGWGSVEARVYFELKCANENILFRLGRRMF